MISTANKASWEGTQQLCNASYKYYYKINSGSLISENISKIRQYNKLFTGNPSVGNVMSGELDLEIFQSQETANIPRMAKISVYAEATITASGYVIPKVCTGIYYIDTRSKTDKSEKMSMHCYDGIIFLEQPYNSSYSTAQTDKRIVRDIVNQVSPYLASTEMTLPWSDAESYSVPFTAGTYTMREIISYIAASHMCNVIVHPLTNQLWFIPITGITGTYEGTADITWNYYTLKTGPTASYSGLEIALDNSQGYQAGTTSGEIFRLECPWATQTMADRCYSAISNWTYKPFEIERAYLVPVYNLGDKVECYGKDGMGAFSGIITSFSSTATSSCTADIGSDYEEQIDNEIQYKPKSRRMWERELANTKTTFEVLTQEIIGRVEQVEESTIDDNYLAYPFRYGTLTHNGVDFTDNGDGSITINRTALASFYYALESPQKLPTGTYTLSGGVSSLCPLFVSNNDTSTLIGVDSGNGITFTLAEATNVLIRYFIAKDKVFDNITVYPMLAKSSSVKPWKSPVASLTSQVKINAGNIENKVSMTDYNGAEIASRINQSASTVQIQAQHVDLQGYVTFSALDSGGYVTDTDLQDASGTTEINGGLIRTGVIKVGGDSGNINGEILICGNDDNDIRVKLDKNGISLGANERISCSNLHGGTIKLGGQDNISGTLELYNIYSEKITQLDNYGITLYDRGGRKVGQIYGGQESTGTQQMFDLGPGGINIRRGTGLNTVAVFSKDGIMLGTDTSPKFFTVANSSTLYSTCRGIMFGTPSGKRVEISDSEIRFYNSSNVLKTTYPGNNN